jgi:hypothetical protein
MVRFGWHVEDGLGAHILPGKMSAHEHTGISHATCSIEVRHGRCRRECQTCQLAVATRCHPDVLERRWLRTENRCRPSSPCHSTTCSMITCAKQITPRTACVVAHAGCRYLMWPATPLFCRAQVRRVGVALAHGDTASGWNGHLLTELAVALAAQGELVLRLHLSLPSR